MACWLLALALLAVEPPTVLNGGYETLRGWALGTGQIVDLPGHGRCLRFDREGTALQEIPVEPPGRFTAAVDLKVAQVTPRGPLGYAYVAVYQTDTAGELVAFKDFAQATGSRDWQRASYTFELHPAARFISLRCGLYQAAGEAWFDGWTLVPGSQAADYQELAPAAAGALRIGILNEPGLPVSGAGSDPAALATLLAAPGRELVAVSAAQLADATWLRPERLALVVLPYGASFPATARTAWVSYLRRGGMFVNLGGYPFQNLLLPAAGGWQPEATVLAERITAALAPQRSLLPDGSFERGQVAEGGQTLDGAWHRNSAAAELVASGARDGQRCLRVTATPGPTDDERKFWCDLPAERRNYRLQGWLRTVDVGGAGFAYLAVYQYDAAGKLLAWRDLVQLSGTHAWRAISFDFTPEPGVSRLHLKLGLYRAHGTAWFDDLRLGDVSGLTPPPLNSSNGQPGDGLKLLPTQIGVCDPANPLRRVTRLRTAADQHLVQAKVDAALPLRGWVASGVDGHDQARWLPWLETADLYGRPRGAAGGLLWHYGGFYAGSAWAWSGVTSHDLFTARNAPARAALQEVVTALLRGAFLRHLRCDRDLLRPAEPLTVSVTLDRLRPLPATVLRCSARGESGPPLWSTEQPVAAGEGPVTLSATWPAAQPAAALTHLTAELLLEGRPIDRLTRGVVTAQEPRLPALSFADNGFRLGSRRLFVFGTDDYAETFRAAAQNPLSWSQDLTAARDIGLDLYENLQYVNPDHTFSATEWASFRALATLCEQQHLIYMPGLLIGHDVVCDDAELGRQSALCAEFGRRLGDFPALLWYLNGDYQLRADERPEATAALWTAWLHRRYSTAADLEAAWGAGRAQRVGDRYPWPPPRSGRFDDPVQLDQLAFQHDLLRRWNTAHVAALRQQGLRQPITSEYYQRPFGGMDLRATIADQDVSNFGYFDVPGDDLDKLPLRLALNDLRLRGKGVALGEYGVKTHPAWAVENGGQGYHIVRSEAQQEQLFATVAAYTLAMGGCKIQNWCLRDSAGWVFPWGLFYPQQRVPKDVAAIHRNLALLWHRLAPRDETPPVGLLLNGRLRAGEDDQLGLRVADRAADTLLGLQVPFASFDEGGCAALPPAVRAVVAPCLYTLSDPEAADLQAWVSRGGQLLLTGDLTLDERRQPTVAARLTQLAGLRLRDRLAPAPVRSGPDCPVDLGAWGGRVTLRPSLRLEPAGATVLAAAAGNPLLTRFRLGQGTVWFVNDPLELAAGSPLRGIYAAFLDAAGVRWTRPAPAPAELHLLSQPTAAGRLWMAFDRRASGAAASVRVDLPAGALHLGLRPRWPAVAHVAPVGVQVLLAAGRSTWRGEPQLTATGLQGAVTLDGRGLSSSRQLLLAPFSLGSVALPPRPGTFRVLAGEAREGRWQTYERLTLPGSALRLTLDADRRTALLLICEPAAEAAAVATAERLLRRPATTPGI
ncbi:MAG: beta-galactosidase [Fimbriimonadaceae bacterium]|nr:beta-galactosidase [Fimbriimonadaceae bacterium]